MGTYTPDFTVASFTCITCRLGDILGSGQFGNVYKGVWQSPTRGEVEVAVKTLKEGSGEEDRVKFLQEAAIMGQFKHPNVVEMCGVVTVGEPVSLSIFEREGVMFIIHHRFCWYWRC